MTNSPSVERRKPKNQALRNFIEWVEKTEFYGKFTVTCRKGEALSFDTNATFRAEDFAEPRFVPDKDLTSTPPE